jgi:dCMP deaminase
MPTQKEFDKIYINMAKQIAGLSKCVSWNVGALLVKDNRPISIGYNGTLPGHINCCDMFDKDNFDREEHHKWSLKNEIHAEINLLGWAAKHGIPTEGTTVYCTLQPCNDCLRNMPAFGIERIVFDQYYDKCTYSSDVISMLKLAGISLENLDGTKIV